MPLFSTSVLILKFTIPSLWLCGLSVAFPFWGKWRLCMHDIGFLQPVVSALCPKWREETSVRVNLDGGMPYLVGRVGCGV